MPRFVQEKYQVTESPYDDESREHQWQRDSSARDRKGTRSGATAFFNALPPGMNIEDQRDADMGTFKFPSCPDASDVTQDCGPKSFRSGFDRKACCPTDDMYTREHNDAFYDDPEVDGQHGFVERNNYLDRLATFGVLLYPLANAAHHFMSSCWVS